MLLQRLPLIALPFLALTNSLPTTPSNHQPLRFTKDGTFQLSVFADLHYGEAEDLDWGPQQDINTTRVIKAILSHETPQLVVLNGDLITGENTNLPNSSHYIDEIVKPLVQRGLKLASTYGNHDSNFNLSRRDMLEREGRYAGSLTRDMMAPAGEVVDNYTTGVTNYYLLVYSADRRETVPRLLLWFFDSRGGNEYQQLDENGDTVNIPGWVDESVVTWFTATRDSLFALHNHSIPSLAFVHIPISAMLAFQNTGVRPHREPGINDDVPLAAQGEDTPFMTALLNTSNLLAVFSGHDHGDDWCYKWTSDLPLPSPSLPSTSLAGNGLNLCFNRHSGYGGYGNWMRGARQILLDEKDLCNSNGEGKKGGGGGDYAVETWNRLEDGSVSGKVTLNATYGVDWYPKVGVKYS